MPPTSTGCWPTSSRTKTCPATSCDPVRSPAGSDAVGASAAPGAACVSPPRCRSPACGKKGPPLPPLVRVPARPESSSAAARRRRRVPVVRSPGRQHRRHTPADIERVDSLRVHRPAPPAHRGHRQVRHARRVDPGAQPPEDDESPPPQRGDSAAEPAGTAAAPPHRWRNGVRPGRPARGRRDRSARRRLTTVDRRRGSSRRRSHRAVARSRSLRAAAADAAAARATISSVGVSRKGQKARRRRAPAGAARRRRRRRRGAPRRVVRTPSGVDR